MSINNQIFEHFREEKNKIKEAKEILKKSGFYVDNLLSIHDVQQFYDCTDIEAIGLLDDVMCGERLVATIFEEIHQKAMKNNLKAKLKKD